MAGVSAAHCLWTNRSTQRTPDILGFHARSASRVLWAYSSKFLIGVLVGRTLDATCRTSIFCPSDSARWPPRNVDSASGTRCSGLQRPSWLQQDVGPRCGPGFSFSAPIGTLTSSERLCGGASASFLAQDTQSPLCCQALDLFCDRRSVFCPCAGDRNRRHNAVAHVFHEAAQEAGFRQSKRESWSPPAPPRHRQTSPSRQPRTPRRRVDPPTRKV